MQGAVNFVRGDALAFGCRNVKAQKDRGRGVDGHGGTYFVQRNFLEQRFHVFQAAYRDADLAHFPLGHRVIRVITDLGGQVESDGQARLPLLQQVAEPAVGVGGGGVAGVLPHGPEAAPVGIGLNAPGVGELAGVTQVLMIVETPGVQTPRVQVLGAIKGLNFDVTIGKKFGLALRIFFHGWAEGLG